MTKSTDKAEMIYFICLLWIICAMFLPLACSVQTSFPYVTWEAETRIIRLGETVILTCTVHNIEAINLRKTRQWSRESRLVCYNGQPTNPLKYMECLQRNKFKLLIYNVTEADLNRDYQCLYSFDTYSKNLNITEENFEYLPPENTRKLEYNYARNGNLSIKLNMEKVFPLPNCTIEFETFQLTFTKSTYKKNGLYFEVDFAHQSHIVFNESTQFNVTCQLLQEYLIATRIIRVPKGDTNVDVSDEHSTNYVYILLPVLGILVALGIVITAVYKIVKRPTCRQNADDYQMVYDSRGNTHMESCTTVQDSLTPEIPEEEQLTENIEGRKKSE